MKELTGQNKNKIFKKIPSGAIFLLATAE